MIKEISREEFEELVMKYTKNICNDIIKNGFNGIEGWVRELISSEYILNQNIEDDMRIEHLVNNTYQVTDGSTIWFQGSLSDCESYINQNK